MFHFKKKESLLPPSSNVVPQLANSKREELLWSDLVVTVSKIFCIVSGR